MLDGTRMSRIQRLLPFLAAFLAACASQGSAGVSESRELLVTLHNYKAGERYELASESHTDRVAYYSGERADAVRKVQSDDVMTAFLSELERQGLGTHARVGAAPAIGAGDVVRWGLEVESGPQKLHWLVGTGTSADDWQAFQSCRDMFLEVYNRTVSYQSVRNESGKQFFDEQARSASGKAPRR